MHNILWTNMNCGLSMRDELFCYVRRFVGWRWSS